MIMAVIGIDSHKDVLTGCLVDASGVSIEQRSIAFTTAGHAELVAWARSAGVQRVVHRPRRQLRPPSHCGPHRRWGAGGGGAPDR